MIEFEDRSEQAADSRLAKKIDDIKAELEGKTFDQLPRPQRLEILSRMHDLALELSKTHAIVNPGNITTYKITGSDIELSNLRIKIVEEMFDAEGVTDLEEEWNLDKKNLLEEPDDYRKAIIANLSRPGSKG